MGFRPEAIRGVGVDPAGAVDYRLLRMSIVADYRKKRLDRDEVCDAHPELLRAARQVGEPTRLDCPICEEAKVVLVTYVFGPRLPPYGRCVTTRAEMRALSTRADELAAYVVEVCPNCSWNHLARVLPVGGGRSLPATRRARPAR